MANLLKIALLSFLILNFVSCGGASSRKFQGDGGGPSAVPTPTPAPTPAPTPDPTCEKQYNVTVTWAYDPVELTTISNFTVYYGEITKTYYFDTDVPAPNLTVNFNVPSGRFYYFAATALSKASIRSNYSTEKTLDLTDCRTNITLDGKVFTHKLKFSLASDGEVQVDEQPEVVLRFDNH